MSGWLAACATAPPGPRGASPRRVAAEALRAAAAGQLQALEPLLDEQGRAWLRSEAGRRWLRAQRAEQAERRRRLLEGRPGAERQVLRWRRADGTHRWAAFGKAPDGRWRVLAGVGPLAAGGSPQAALAALREALRELWGAPWWGVLAPAVAYRWRARIGRLLGELAAVEALRVRRSGPRATATTPAGRRIGLLREGGLWFVTSIGPLP